MTEKFFNASIIASTKLASIINSLFFSFKWIFEIIFFPFLETKTLSIFIDLIVKIFNIRLYVFNRDEDTCSLDNAIFLASEFVTSILQ